jgi:DnaK suppressor protein
MSDTFEGLRTQGGVNRLLGETQGEELDEEFLARQRTRLEGMRSALLRDHAGIHEEGKRWGGGGHYAPQDPEDVRAHILAEEVDTVLDRRLVRRLGLVERALEKIKDGTYGVCDATGERIPKGRLQAVPEAIYTIEVQRALEGEA